MEQSPIHLSPLTLFIKEERPEAATDPRYRAEQGRLRQTATQGLKQNERQEAYRLSREPEEAAAAARGRVRATEVALENGV